MLADINPQLKDEIEDEPSNIGNRKFEGLFLFL